ncbi:TniQ family protein, partial [Paenibacillus sp. MAH-36]|uniref:TniQ family protein n=1 Tax=Paenibacillus sp. GCM10012304 TaxID=3317341 RepID=UPI0036131785
MFKGRMFCKRADLNEEESLTSYLCRISKLNRYVSYSYLVSDLKMTISKFNNNAFNSHQINQVGVLVSKPPELLLKHSNIRIEELTGKDLADKLLMKNRIKYCPACLIGNKHHRLSWLLYPLNICTKHKISLIEKCPRCNSLICLESVLNGNCKVCNFNLSQANLNRTVPLETIITPQLYLYNELFNPLRTQCPPLNLCILDFLILAESSYYIIEGLKSFLGDEHIIS